MFYLYVLKSHKDKKLYIGSNKNLKNRFSEHNSGKVVSTKSTRPFTLIYYEAYLFEKDCRLRESSIKKSGSVYKSLTKRIVRNLGD